MTLDNDVRDSKVMIFELNEEKEPLCGNQAEGTVCAKALDKLEQIWHVSETEGRQG